MITINEIQIKLANEIKDSGISQTELAKLLNVKQPTIAQYISGRAMPALDTFANLCNILDIDANDILCINKKTEHEKIKYNINAKNFNNNNLY